MGAVSTILQYEYISHLIEVSSCRSRVGERQLQNLLGVDDVDCAHRHGQPRRAHVVRVKHAQRSRDAVKQVGGFQMKRSIQ